MLHRVLFWLLGAIALGIASLVINAILILLKMGNVKTITFLVRLRGALKEIPGDMLLSCKGRDVVLMHFDVSNKTERAIPVYTGVVTWRGGPRLARRIKGKVRRQLALRTIPLILVFMPILVLSLWAAIFVDWRASSITVLVILHQFFPFYLFEYPGFIGLFEGD
jgi:hypothetical protein